MEYILCRMPQNHPVTNYNRKITSCNYAITTFNYIIISYDLLFKLKMITFVFAHNPIFN